MALDVEFLIELQLLFLQFNPNFIANVFNSFEYEPQFQIK